MNRRSFIRAGGAARGAGGDVVVAMDGQDDDMLQELSILRLKPGQVLESAQPLERVFLLLRGRVRFTQGKTSAEAGRTSLFDDPPWALQAPASARVEIAARDEAELILLQTENARDFPARIHSPSTCRSERRGEGTVGEAATRIVRTMFDNRDAPASNLVVGEVVAPPGRWSSYPPHHHPQPEIYYYRFAPENGFGFAMVGDQSFTVRTGDTVLIRSGQVHPQAAAPGYAMWYLWSIRHLDGNRYGTPVYQDEHAWTARAAGSAPRSAPAAIPAPKGGTT
jgi:5-deoxy-glucuronate isomerase